MWQSQAQLVRLRLPPPSPRLEPWHPIHLAPANPLPNIPLRSGPACRFPLQCQVSVCFLASGWLCRPTPPCPGHWSSEEGGFSCTRSAVVPLAQFPRTAGLGGGVGREVGWRVLGFYVGDAVLCNEEWVWVWVQQEVYLHTCQRVDVLRLFACGACVNGVGDAWD